MTPRPDRRDVARALRRLQRRRKRILALTVLAVLLAAAALLLATVFRPMVHPGRAMLPTLTPGQRCFVNTLDHTPERGQIACFSRRDGNGSPMTLRVIALPGDEVSLTEDGTLLLNGQPLAEPYAWLSPVGTADLPASLLIPEGRLFAIGDNRAEALDSRISTVGLFDLTEVTGVMWE